MNKYNPSKSAEQQCWKCTPTLEEILRRPEVKLNSLIETTNLDRIANTDQAREQVEIQVKYQGYLQRELEDESPVP